MFFTKFDPLTTEAVDKAVAAKQAPCGESCGCLKGLKFTARLEGEYAPEELSYEILDEKTLKFRENGKEYTAPYGAAGLDPIVILTHLVPGSSRGWHLVIDKRSWAITAFETWFGISVPVGTDLMGMKEPDYYRDIPRETQRQYYFGWADKGDNEKPAFHTTTNRIEGRGLCWNMDCGYRFLTFNPSVVCTTVVELGGECGGITMTNPADYIRIDDENYIFARWEVEFSGKMWLEVVNFFDFKAAGVEMGFEEDNSFTYHLNKACLELTGDVAHLETITDFGNKKPPMANMTKKGARYSYRPMDIDVPMTHEEALAHAAESQHILDNGGRNIMASGNNLKPVYTLVGKTFKVVPDKGKYAQAPWSGNRDYWYEYEFISEEKLKWRAPGRDWEEQKYVCFEPDKDLFFFSHMIGGDPNYSMLSQVADFRSALTTTITCGIGNWHSEWESGAEVAFGTLAYGDLKAPFARRHQFTDELIGRSFAWAYSETMSSIHVYSSPESYSWTIFQGDNSGGATWSSPCFYIKLRDGVYLFQWVEENCNGSQGLVIMNRKIQHDGGFFYGVSHNGLMMNVTGAFMRELGKFDIMKYFSQDV